MGDNIARPQLERQTSRSASEITAVPESAASIQPPAITISRPQKRIIWQEQALKDPESGIVDILPWLWPNHSIWIFITIASTFVLISIIPIMLIDILTSAAVALPSTEVSTTSPIVARSFQLESQPWNYDNLCQPRANQCQLGTYTTRNSKTMDLVWFDQGCKKVDHVAACQDLACVGSTIVLSAVDTSEAAYPDPVLVQFQDPENWLDIPTIMYRGAAYSQAQNEAGNSFGPGSDIEFFSLLWFDC